MENQVKRTDTHDWIRATVKMATGEKLSFTISYRGTKFSVTPTKQSNVDAIKLALKSFNEIYKLREKETNGEMLDRFMSDIKTFAF